MGARSNVNLVKINNVNAKYEGITSYSHWGGVRTVLKIRQLKQ